MNTLTISQIFSHLDDYQQSYLAILADAAQYYTPVEGAYIDVWPFARRDLYLGDLLQLWFAEKWRQSPQPAFGFELFYNTAFAEQDLEPRFIYAITGNSLTFAQDAQAWRQSSSNHEDLTLVNLSKYLLEYQNLTRPVQQQSVAYRTV